MIPGLEGALKARRKYVDDSSEVSTGAGRAELNAAISSGASRFLALQGGMKKSPSGFTGLVNQGATCYLNSLIQSLFMLPEFRLALFNWEYVAEVHGEEARCLSRQLQRLFSQLQLSSRPAITTGSLTKSFGWSSSEAFVQQDVHECMTAIFDILQDQSLGEHIAGSHQGRLFDYLLCSNCGDRRGRQDQFRDIHLEVRGMRSVEQMLRAFVTGEQLDGVDCSACGGRHAHTKGLAIDTVPDVLTLQLKRFDLDYSTWQRVKLNDRISIPGVLNMLPFMRNAPSQEDGGTSSSMEYELLSVLMHIGSALSGHYFAYIRDLASRRWLKFNDAAVTELEPGQIEAILGETDEAGAAESSANLNAAAAAAETPLKGASSNAYMLVYRRLNHRNLAAVDDASIPGELAKEVADENIKFEKLKAEWEEERKWLNVTVYHDGPAKSIRVHQDCTIAELTAKAVEAFHPALAGIALARVRLRTFDSLRNACLAPLGENAVVLSEVAVDTMRRPLKFEVCEEGGEFEEYLIDGLSMGLLHLVDRKGGDAGMFSSPTSVCVKNDATVGHLRAAVAKRLKLSVGNTALVWFPGDAPVQLDNDAASIREFNMSAGDTVHVEERLASEPLFLVQYFEGLANLVTIKFNDPRSNPVPSEGAKQDGSSGGIAAMIKQMHADELALNGEFKHVKIDIRSSLRELKAAISTQLSLHVNEFKVRRSAGGLELKDLDASLVVHGIEDSHTLHIKVGKPMVPGEWQFNLKFVAAFNSPAVALGPVVLTEAMTVREAKATLYDMFGETHGVPSIEHMRLRSASGTGVVGGVKLNKVIADDATIGSTFGDKIADGKMIAIQPISSNETFTSEHMLLRVHSWRPVTKQLSPVDEIAVLRSATYNDLKVQLAASGATLAPDIAIVKPFAYLLKDLKNLPLLKWGQQPRADSQITAAPLRLQDGDVIVFKDKNEPEDLVVDVTTDCSGSELTGATNRGAPSEPLFHIFTPAEQIKREELQRKREAEVKLEAEERADEIRRRIAGHRACSNEASADGVEGDHGRETKPCGNPTQPPPPPLPGV